MRQLKLKNHTEFKLKERRKLKRHSVYSSDQMHVTIITNQDQKIEGKLFDISSSGAKIVLQGKDLNLENPNSLIDRFIVSKGKVKIAEYENIRLANQYKNGENTFLGLDFSTSHLSQAKSERRNPRIPTHALARPIALVSLPYKYETYLHFEIENVSLTGMTFKTGDSDAFILRGTLLQNIEVHFPSVGSIKVKCVVKHHYLDASGRVQKIGLEFTGKNKKFRKYFVKYVLAFSKSFEDRFISSMTIKEFNVKKIKSHVYVYIICIYIFSRYNKIFLML